MEGRMRGERREDRIEERGAESDQREEAGGGGGGGGGGGTVRYASVGALQVRLLCAAV